MVAFPRPATKLPPLPRFCSVTPRLSWAAEPTRHGPMQPNSFRTCARDRVYPLVFRQKLPTLTCFRWASRVSTSCADCHGQRGEGVADFYSEAIGRRPLDGGTDQSHHRHDARRRSRDVRRRGRGCGRLLHPSRFLQPAAQLRNRPPSVQFSRLTGPQLRQSMADLYGRFENPAWLAKNSAV